MITEEQKAKQLIATFGLKLAIECCNEVLGYMGADRGYAFWYSVRKILKSKLNE